MNVDRVRELMVIGTFLNIGISFLSNLFLAIIIIACAVFITMRLKKGVDKNRD